LWHWSRRKEFTRVEPQDAKDVDSNWFGNPGRERRTFVVGDIRVMGWGAEDHLKGGLDSHATKDLERRRIRKG